MQKLYSSYTIWERKYMSFLHICGDKAIFLLFYDNEDPEYE